MKHNAKKDLERAKQELQEAKANYLRSLGWPVSQEARVRFHGQYAQAIQWLRKLTAAIERKQGGLSC